uniref:Retrotransposon protein, putative, Ty1-copia subclass n=1 Tax=Oryza sativa subsp. japonica TaxID=39947 RepID=Q2QRS6_ORYSJ|nr:retrotransposon protein, putative, Ty1-copia subclass [Oryza sativa Japonica Group]
MMRKIIGNSISHHLITDKFPKSSDFVCTACATGKLILRPSYLKIRAEPLKFLERIQGDICGPIVPRFGPFRYFMVLIDASTRWSHVCLLSTRNHVFAKLMSQIIRLKANYPEHRIQSIRMDNAAEFTSHAFDDYCMALGIQVQHSVSYVHTQNGLAESLIKRIKLIARPLLMNCKLPSSCWGHAVLHAADLVQLRPTAYHETSRMQLVRGNPPSIFHLHKFGYAVYIPISQPQHTAMGPHRKVGIYVGFKSPSIIKYLEPLTGDLFTARFADSIFDEEHFLALGGEFKYQKECQEIDWDAQGIPASDPRPTEAEFQVQKIIHLQRLANNLPDTFTNYKGVTKSFIPAQNAPEIVEVPNKTTQLPLTKKRGRSMATQRETIANKQRKTVNANQPLVGTHQIDTICQADRDSLQPSSVVHNAETRNSEDHRHIVSGHHNESIRVDEIAINYSETRESFDRRATIVDTNFSEQIAECLQVDPEPRSIKECQKRSDWNKWKDAIDAELASLYKRDVFSAVMPTPRGIFPVGYKWVFVRKRNENNEVLMDVVTAYLYESLDSDIYMKVPDGIDIPNQKSPTGFCIISVYVDDLNIIGNTQDINEARHHLKTEFEMKDLGQTKFYLGLQLEHLPSGILVHQSAYTQKILEKFNMDKSYSSKTPMVARSLDVEKDPFRPKEDGEDVLGPDFPYLSVIGALMYHANSMRPDIAFSVNLLARYSAAPTNRHWTGVKNVFRYINGTRDLGLFFKKNQDSTLIGYTNAGYLSDPHNARSQTGFVFLQGGTAISWKSSKQTLVATSTNHSEIIALYEASHECVWLHRMVNHILTSCCIGSLESPTIIYEDNAACIVQMETGYIKSNITKHIAPKLFYPHELQQHGDINILQTKSCDNLADLFTKSLPYSTFFKCVEGIDI